MADHLNIPDLLQLPTKRGPGYDPNAPKPLRSERATTLRGVLEGLESIAQVNPDDAQDDAVDEIVIKFTGTQVFTTTAFKKLGLVPLAVTDDKRYYALSNPEARTALTKLIGRYIDPADDLESVTKTLRGELAKIEGVELYGREDRIGDDLRAPTGDEVVDLDVAVWPTSLEKQSDRRRGKERVQRIVDVLVEHSQRDERVRALAVDDADPDRLVVHARVDADAFEALAEHPIVERLRGPLRARVTQAALQELILPDGAVLPEGEPVGVIDDLVVDSNPWLDGVIEEQREFPYAGALGQHTDHGTQVASVAAYGDVSKLLDPDFDGQPLPLYVARIAQADTNLETRVAGNAAQRIAEALDWLKSKGVRVVVMSLGLAHADDGAITSDLSSTIDAKAREHDLVIVLSAGNIAHDLTSLASYPDFLQDDTSKVAAPGTAALALTVTAIAENDVIDRTVRPHAVAVAAAGKHSPFARSGPVRSSAARGRQKPEFDAHGGNWAVDQAAGTIITGAAELAVTTLIPPMNGRLFGAASGTSLAAPRVAREVALIAGRYPEAGANLLRALTALSGSRRFRRGDSRPPFHTSSYGTPDAQTILESTGTRVVFTHQGSMKTQSHAVLELPIPELFALGSSQREIRVALAFDPPVRRSRRDYIAGRMDFVFIQKEDLDAIRSSYAKQPSVAAAKADDIERFKRLQGRKLEPAKTTYLSDTLMQRSYFSPSDGWDPNDENYYLVLTHSLSPWTPAQTSAYTDQAFAVAVEIVDHDRLDIDLYAEAQAKLQARSTARVGGQ